MANADFILFLTRKTTAFLESYWKGQCGQFSAWPYSSRPFSPNKGHFFHLYSRATDQAWDGSSVFQGIKESVGESQLTRIKKNALGDILKSILWGELFAWNIASQLVYELDDIELKMAFSGQVYDEARHFFILREYLKYLDYDPQGLDPFFLVAMRQVLSEKDIYVRIIALQVIVEGTAMAVFQYLYELKTDKALTPLLEYIIRDEGRHLSIASHYLPKVIPTLSTKRLLTIRSKIIRISHLLGQSMRSQIDHFRIINADPAEFLKRVDRTIINLTRRWGNIPTTNLKLIQVDDPDSPGYELKLKLWFPDEQAKNSPYLKIHDKCMGLLAKMVKQ